MDRLKALTIFKAVVEHGGFARAASAMTLSTSVVTRSVQELEELLGVRLLLRTTRSVALTSVGEAIFTRAGDLLASYDELEAFSSLSTSEPQGLIRIAASAAYGRCYLGRALAAFRNRWPSVSVDLRLRDGAIASAVDDADLVLCTSADLRPSMIARELAQVDVGLWASATYLRAHGQPTCPKDLGRFDCLVNRSQRAMGWTLTHQDGEQREEIAVHGVMNSTHDEVLMEAAIHGAGIVQLPSFMIGAAHQDGLLCRVLADWHADPISLHLSYASRRNQPLAVRKLIEHFVEWFEAPAGSLEPPRSPSRVPMRVEMREQLAA